VSTSSAYFHPFLLELCSPETTQSTGGQFSNGFVKYDCVASINTKCDQRLSLVLPSSPNPSQQQDGRTYTICNNVLSSLHMDPFLSSWHFEPLRLCKNRLQSNRTNSQYLFLE